MADIRHLQFDANVEEPNEGFDPIPAGSYLVVICESEWQENKAKTGQYLKLTLEVIDGEYKGRKLFARLNLDNPNEKAVQIARGELSAICRAVGVLVPKDTVELHDIPLVAKVKLRKREDNGEMANEISGFSAREAASNPQQPGGASRTQTNGARPPVTQQGTVPPWKR